MSLYSIKCSNSTENNNIEIKHKTVGKINFYPSCVKCDFKKFETIDKEKLSDLLKVWTMYKTMFPYCLMCRKKQQQQKTKPKTVCYYHVIVTVCYYLTK